jgi:predicted phosphodiesterase
MSRPLLRLVFALFLLVVSFSENFAWAKQPSEEAVTNAKYVKEITQIALLPENFKPSKAHSHGTRRLIFIGDVHGAYNELVALLEKVKYKSDTGIKPCDIAFLMQDHVVFLGDLVSKGPHSSKVVNLAMKLNASCVMGNHDYELLDWMGHIKSVGDTRLDTFINPEDLPNELVLGVEEHSIAMGFNAQAASWMLECPLILKVGEVEGEEFVAVHAGILPNKPFEEQGNRPLCGQD